MGKSKGAAHCHSKYSPILYEHGLSPHVPSPLPSKWLFAIPSLWSCKLGRGCRSRSLTKTRETLKHSSRSFPITHLFYQGSWYTLSLFNLVANGVQLAVSQRLLLSGRWRDAAPFTPLWSINLPPLYFLRIDATSSNKSAASSCCSPDGRNQQMPSLFPCGQTNCCTARCTFPERSPGRLCYFC